MGLPNTRNTLIVRYCSHIQILQVLRSIVWFAFILEHKIDYLIKQVIQNGTFTASQFYIQLFRLPHVRSTYSFYITKSTQIYFATFDCPQPATVAFKAAVTRRFLS